VSANPTVVDMQQLEWFNHQHILRKFEDPQTQELLVKDIMNVLMNYFSPELR
jgi:hypothetical protein